MAVSPINVTRVTQNLQSMSLLDSLRQNTLDLFLEQNRLATGNKLNAPSEDPILASRALDLSEVLDRQDQVLNNINYADSFLSTTDSSIGEINDLLIEAHDIASEMVNSTADQSQRESMAELVNGIIDQLTNVGNRMYEGVYLFAGQQTKNPPFVQTRGGVEYAGDTGDLTVHIDNGDDPRINLTGAELFGALNGRIDGWVDLDPALTEDTRLADLNGIDNVGVETGIMSVTLDNPQVNFQADLRTADTVGDVVDILNGAAEEAGLNVGPGGDFNVSINGAGNGLLVQVGAGTVTIDDVGEGTVARDLGINGSGIIINGQNLDPRVTSMTTINSLFGGSGANLGSILVSNGEKEETIDLSEADTVQDILNAINTAELKVKAEINSQGNAIDVINTLSGVEMSIAEAGDDTAEKLGIRSFHGGTDLDDLNDGDGVSVKQGVADFHVWAKDGSSFDVNLDGAETIQDVLDKINDAANDAGVNVTADLPMTGNGIRLEDNTGGGGTLQVQRMNYSYAIDDLGMNQQVSDPAATELIGQDVNGIKPDSVFSALLELHEALVSGGEHVEQEITKAGEKLSGFVDQAATWQGVVGARSRAMQTRLQFTEDAVITTRKLLSETKDLDYVEAVTRFQQAQTTLQANLMTGQKMLSLSLLNFIQ
jgi:flagellar hook-associated protein 3 FlgL